MPRKTGQLNKINPDEMAEWEHKLAQEGLGVVGEDDAARKLQVVREEQTSGVSEDAVRQAIQEYWVYRAGDRHGEHKKAALDIAKRMGVSSHDIDEALMRVVEEDVAEVDKSILTFAEDAVLKNKAIKFRTDALRRAMLQYAKASFPDFSPNALDGIIDRVTDRMAA